jgi:hypothetical protein
MRRSWLYFAIRSDAAHGAGLDLAAVGGDGEIRNGVIFGFAGAVAHHGCIGMAMCQFDGVQCFSEGADLVHLDQDGVCHAKVDTLLEELPRW